MMQFFPIFFCDAHQTAHDSLSKYYIKIITNLGNTTLNGKLLGLCEYVIIDNKHVLVTKYITTGVLFMTRTLLSTLTASCADN